jgi:glycosyltransferase 2 family protein
VFLGASIWVICQELQQYESHDIWRQLTAIPRSGVGWAIALTFLNCWIFTEYDTLAARYVCHSLPYPQTALAAAISSLDWILAAAVLYSLLPEQALASYAVCFGIYLLAQFAGVVSNIPSGLGYLKR